jgi:hypothetical protein
VFAVKPYKSDTSFSALSRRLGIKSGMTVRLVGAPPGFAETLGELPEQAILRSGARGRSDLVIWFPVSSAELQKEIRRISLLARGMPLWIAWRKKSTSRSSRSSFALERAVPRPSEKEVRDAGLAAGLVDHKVCAIDASWSGLLFAPRRQRVRNLTAGDIAKAPNRRAHRRPGE